MAPDDLRAGLRRDTVFGVFAARSDPTLFLICAKILVQRQSRAQAAQELRLNADRSSAIM
jgi:hypothetical protein